MIPPIVFYVIVVVVAASAFGVGLAFVHDSIDRAWGDRLRAWWKRRAVARAFRAARGKSLQLPGGAPRSRQEIRHEVRLGEKSLRRAHRAAERRDRRENR